MHNVYIYIGVLLYRNNNYHSSMEPASSSSASGGGCGGHRPPSMSSNTDSPPSCPWRARTRGLFFLSFEIASWKRASACLAISSPTSVIEGETMLGLMMSEGEEGVSVVVVVVDVVVAAGWLGIRS